MGDKYVLFGSREDFEAHRSIGVFEREALIQKVQSASLADTALILESGFFGKLQPLSKFEFLQPHLGKKTEQSPSETVLNNADPSQENLIREAYYRSKGTYRDNNHEIWPALKKAAGDKDFSISEVAAFVHGLSIAEILEHRKDNGVKLAKRYATPVGNVSSQNQTPPDDRTTSEKILDQLATIPVFLWVAMVAMLLVALAAIFPSRSEPSRPLTVEEQTIRDTVRLQRMIEKDEREHREKYEKEYRRQERERR